MLTACSQTTRTSLEKTAESEPSVTTELSVSDTVQPTASTAAQPELSSASQQIWDEYAATYGKLYNNELIMPETAPEAPDLLPLYLEGLKHENPYVRWASASRLFEFKFREERLKICDALKPLLEDKSEIVSKAAAFSIEVLDGSYDGPEFIRSSDGKFVVFHAFHDTRYNDGKIWMDYGDAGGFYHIDAGGSISGIIISPDNTKLAIKTCGRIWSGASVYDIKTGSMRGCNLFQYERLQPLPDGPEGEYNPEPVKPEGFQW